MNKLTLKEILKDFNFKGIDPSTGERWSPKDIVSILGIKAYNKSEELRPIVQKVLDDNPAIVKQYVGGNKKVVGRLLKEVFDETFDGANPTIVQTLIDEILNIKEEI